ncbi:uncharacterized protein LOC142336724 [Convolutriloba macropyga]|uniref:uncharacterized protein LOC142336724 n=1 Tax=Convolutriloba macropyga TaxID=536237 RepID=UPI003F51FC1C
MQLAVSKFFPIFLIIFLLTNCSATPLTQKQDQRTPDGYLVPRNPDDEVFGNQCRSEDDCPAPIWTPTSVIQFPCISLSGIQSGKGRTQGGRCDRIERFNNYFYKTGVIPKSLVCSSVSNCTFYGNDNFALDDPEVQENEKLSWKCQSGSCMLRKRNFDESRPPFELLNGDQMLEEIRKQFKKKCHWRQDSVNTIKDLEVLIEILTNGPTPMVEPEPYYAVSSGLSPEAIEAEQYKQCSASGNQPIPEEEDTITAPESIASIIGGQSSQDLLASVQPPQQGGISKHP